MMAISHVIRLSALSGAILGLVGLPAVGSTIPPIELNEARFSGAFGFTPTGIPSLQGGLFGGADYGLTDRFSLGAGGFWGLDKAYGDEATWVNVRWAALRGSYRLMTFKDSLAMGVSLSVGASNSFNGRIPYGYVPGLHVFFQPALNIALAIPVPWDDREALGQAPLTYRMTVGPALAFNSGLQAFAINTEFAYRIGRGHEVVLGGSSYPYVVLPTGLSWRVSI